MDSATVYRRRWGTLAVLCFSLLVIGLDNTILNVALPTLVKDLHASASELQWMVDSYILVFAGLLLTAGSLGDKFGRKKALSAGLLIFLGGSFAAAFSGSATMLIATRALMGIGGALIMPATLSILTNTFTNPSERAKAIGIWAGVSGLGIAVGPVVGGYLLQHFWWGSVFLVNVPVVIVALAAGWFLIPESRDPASPKLDPIGAGLSIAGLTALVWSIIEAPSHGWTSPTILLGYAVAAVILTGFVAWEIHTDHPMLDVRIFENPRFSAASAAITLVFFAMFGSMFIITQYLQIVRGYTALQAGIRMAPIALVLFIVAPASSTFVQHFGSKVVVAGGLIIAAGSLAMFGMLNEHSSYTMVLLAIMVLGLGMALTMAPATESIMGSLPREKAGVGSAVNDTTRQVGGALGVAIIGSLLSSGYASRVVSGLSGHGLLASTVTSAKDSVGSAIVAARTLGGAQGDTVVAVAKHSFIGAMRPTMFVAAGIALLGAAIVLAFLPARATNEQAVPAAEAETPARTPELAAS